MCGEIADPQQALMASAVHRILPSGNTGSPFPLLACMVEVEDGVRGSNGGGGVGFESLFIYLLTYLFSIFIMLEALSGCDRENMVLGQSFLGCSGGF